MSPQHVKQPTWHIALDFLRSIHTTASTTAAAKRSKSGFPIFLMFTGLLNTTQGPHKSFCLTTQVTGEMELASGHWNQYSFLWLKSIFFTLGSSWCWLLLLCSQATAVEPKDHCEQNDKKSHQENWDNNHFRLMFTHNCQQRKKMQNQGISSTLVLYNNVATIHFSNFQT